MQPGMIYSAGVHPWDTLAPSADRYIDETRELARSGSITADLTGLQALRLTYRATYFADRR